MSPGERYSSSSSQSNSTHQQPLDKDENNNDIVDDKISDQNDSDSTFDQKKEKCMPAKSDLVWRNIIAFIILHSLMLWGYHRVITDEQFQFKTYLFSYFIGVFSLIGITAGYHRLFSHRSYKARLPLRILLAFQGTMALQNDIFEWCRDHRTNGDPHNSKRGFFFAHMGWLCVKKHTDVKEKGKTCDLSDLWADPVVRFQRRFYIPLVILCWGLIPTFIPYYVWNESLLNSILLCVFVRYVICLHLTWLVNSAAHLWGERPYNKNIGPTDSHLVVSTLLGEGFHNYHHTFPYDYKAAEFKWDLNANFSSFFIDVMAWCGQAYGLKTVPEKVVKARQARTGYALDNPYWRWFNGLVGWITSILFTTSFIWTGWALRMVYFRSYTC